MTDLVVVVDGLGFAEAPRWRQEWFSNFYAAASSLSTPMAASSGWCTSRATIRPRLRVGATSILAIDRARVDVPENLDSSLTKSGTAT